MDTNMQFTINSFRQLFPDISLIFSKTPDSCRQCHFGPVHYILATNSTMSAPYTTPWRQTQPCRHSTLHPGDKLNHVGNKVDRVGDNVDRDKMSNSSCCRFVATTGNKVDRIGNRVDGISNKVVRIGDSRLRCQFWRQSTSLPVCTGL